MRKYTVICCGTGFSICVILLVAYKEHNDFTIGMCIGRVPGHVPFTTESFNLGPQTIRS